MWHWANLVMLFVYQKGMWLVIKLQPISVYRDLICMYSAVDVGGNKIFERSFNFCLSTISSVLSFLLLLRLSDPLDFCMSVRDGPAIALYLHLHCHTFLMTNWEIRNDRLYCLT